MTKEERIQAEFLRRLALVPRGGMTKEQVLVAATRQIESDDAVSQVNTGTPSSEIEPSRRRGGGRRKQTAFIPPPVTALAAA